MNSEQANSNQLTPDEVPVTPPTPQGESLEGQVVERRSTGVDGQAVQPISESMFDMDHRGASNNDISEVATPLEEV